MQAAIKPIPEEIKAAYVRLQELVTRFIDEETSMGWDARETHAHGFSLRLHAHESAQNCEDCPEEYGALVALDMALFILEEDF